jgi:cell division septation protein DedD
MAKKKTDVATVATGPDPQEILAQVQKDSPELILRKRLQAPFPATQIQWRRADDSSSTCRPAPHMMAMMDRLDDVFGVGGWAVGYEWSQDGVLCELEGEPDDGPPVRRSGVAGTAADAFANACLHMGIGRYLLRVGPQPMGYKGATPRLPDWALPNTPDDPHPYVGCGAPTLTQADLEKAASKLVEAQPPPPATPPQPAADRPPDAKPVAEKQAPAKPEKIETVDDAIQRWAIKMTACETPDDLNAMLPGLKGEKQEWQNSLWMYVKKTAAGDGWEWDASVKKFVQGDSLNF